MSNVVPIRPGPEPAADAPKLPSPVDDLAAMLVEIGKATAEEPLSVEQVAVRLLRGMADRGWNLLRTRDV